MPSLSPARQFSPCLAVGMASTAVKLWEGLLYSLAYSSLPLLEDSPDCGQLGKSHRPQCFWDCQDWQTNPEWRDSKAQPPNYQWPRLPRDSACYQDCISSDGPGRLPEAGAEVPVEVEEYPWLCSLQGVGLPDLTFPSNHRCAVTILSGKSSLHDAFQPK